MPGFGSIDDLTPQGTDDASGQGVSVAPTDVEEKFKNKMKQVAAKEKEVEAMRLAASVGLPHIDLEKFPISQQALRQIPKEQAEALQAVCFYFTQDEIRIGARDANSQAVRDLLFTLQEQNHANGGLYVISEKSYKRVLKLYDTLPVVKAITKDISIHAEDVEKVQATVNDFRSLQAQLEKTSTTDILMLLLGAGLKLGASDVHIEAEEKGIMVRLRLDGILHDAAELPKEAYKQLNSRIKLMSSLKINITDKPQDGRFTIKITEGDVDVRVSTIPTVFGESVVLRLLHQAREGLTLEKIGLYGDAFGKLKREIERPNGMVITTGPTGSGKTTTLYAVLQLLNKPGVKIITLEDPVEYRMGGINQSQIDRSKEYTFAKGLRSILRQDPNIVMVGEIRDFETADIAVQAALTGHLLFSTIHTNNAAGAIPRFLSMGVKPFLLVYALNCVIGQRLVRRICENCKQPAEPTPEQLERINEIVERMPDKEKTAVKGKALSFFKGAGCEVCNKIGYKGRIGIYEIFVMTQTIKELTLTGQASEFEIEQAAVKEGMVTMVQDGILKALDGVTTVDEVFRVIE